MAMSRLGPGCCCPACVIYGDAFGSDSLASSWEEIAGDWSIAAGVLSIEDAAAALMADAVHPDGAGAPHVVRVKIRFSAASDRARVVLAYTDASNYLFAELWTSSGGCPHLRLWERVGGSDNAVTAELTPAVDMPLDAWHTLTLCFLPGESMIDPVQFGTILLTSTGHTVYASGESNPSSPGDRAGVATGATVDGTIDFDDFQFLHHKGEATNTNCPECQQPSNDCLLHSDGFGRADSDDLGCGWEEVEGDADIATGRLVTSSAGAVIRNRTRHPDDSAKVQIVVTFEAASGAIPIVILDYEDDDNFFFVQLEPGSHGDCGRLSFWRRTAGTDAMLGTDSVIAGMSAGAEHTITVCWLGNLIHASVTVAAGGDYAGGSHSVNGEAQAAAEPYTGLGTSAGSSGAVAFDNWALRRTRDDDHPECPDCGQANCTLYCGDPRESMIGETPALPLNCLWNNVAGDWDIEASPDVVFVSACGTLEPLVVSTSDAILINETGHPGLTAEGHLDLTSAAAVDVSTTFYGNTARVLIGVLDDENYLFAEWKWADAEDEAGTLSIGKVVAGAETIIATDDSDLGDAEPQVAGFDPGFVDYPSELRVCYDGYELKASFLNRSAQSFDAKRVYVAGVAGTGWNPGKSGLGTGAATGEVYFANFRFYHDIFGGNSTCIPCSFAPNCSFCIHSIDDECFDRTPPIMLVKLTGVTPSDGLQDSVASGGSGSLDDQVPCWEAGQFNDTFALPYLDENTFTDLCIWESKTGFCWGRPDTFNGGVDRRGAVRFTLQKVQNPSGPAYADARMKVTIWGWGDTPNPDLGSGPTTAPYGRYGEMTTGEGHRDAAGYWDEYFGRWTLINATGTPLRAVDSEFIFDVDCLAAPPTTASAAVVDCLGWLAEDWYYLGAIVPTGSPPSTLNPMSAKYTVVGGIIPHNLYHSTCYVKALV
jgi:hypothetical protein